MRSNVEDCIKEICAEAIAEADSDSFNDAIECAMNDHDFTKEIEEAVNEYDFTDAIRDEFDNYDFDKAIYGSDLACDVASMVDDIKDLQNRLNSLIQTVSRLEVENAALHAGRWHKLCTRFKNFYRRLM